MRLKMSKKVAKPEQKLSMIIEPIISVEGSDNYLTSMFDAGNPPILKSVGYAKAGPSSRDYFSYVITSQGDQVLAIEASEPNMRQIAGDEAKVSFVTAFMNDDGE